MLSALPDIATQIGVGGVLALLVIREVLGFLSKRQPPASIPNPHPRATRAGDLSAEFWLGQFDRLRDAIHDVRDAIDRKE